MLHLKYFFSFGISGNKHVVPKRFECFVDIRLTMNINAIIKLKAQKCCI